MAATFNRICIEEFTVRDQEGTTFTVERGKEYLTGEENEHGNVTVLSRYWVTVPVRIFAGEQQFTK
jgi:hypothetical protein